MLQCGEDPWPIRLNGISLVNATRNPAILRDLIAQGKFGELSRGLAALVPESGRPANHEFRLLHGTDGIWYALFSIAQQGIQKIALLAFERSGPVGEPEKKIMWRILGLAEKLVRELLM